MDMKSQFKTDLGRVKIDSVVIANYAGSVVIESFGIVGMAMYNVKDGIVRLLKKDSLAKGIKVNVTPEGIELDFHVIVSYGVNISVVSDSLICRVRERVEKFTGMTISKINILVEGVRVID